jgi:hypothetical protein
MTRHEVSPGTDPWQPPAEEGEEAGEQQPQQEEDGGAGPSSQQAAEGGVYVKPEPVDEGAPGPSTGPAGGSQQQDGDMRNGRKVPAHLRGVVSETDDLKPRCESPACLLWCPPALFQSNVLCQKCTADMGALQMCGPNSCVHCPEDPICCACCCPR